MPAQIHKSMNLRFCLVHRLNQEVKSINIQILASFGELLTLLLTQIRRCRPKSNTTGFMIAGSILFSRIQTAVMELKIFKSPRFPVPSVSCDACPEMAKLKLQKVQVSSFNQHSVVIQDLFTVNLIKTLVTKLKNHAIHMEDNLGSDLEFTKLPSFKMAI